MSLFEQLKRRNVFRVGTAYLAVSWLLVQIAETLLPVFEFGPGPIRTLVIVLAVGLVPVLILSWLFEITPEGIRRDAEVNHDRPASAQHRERLNQIVIVSLVLAVSYFAIDKFVLSGAVPEAVADEVAIAVLPFVNLSDAEDMVFFSDGVAEDILGLLSQVTGLRCIARSSSFALRDPDMGAGEIGARLGVTHVLTGSLRAYGDQIRLSVRLVDTATESLVWSDSYDRNLDDVFAIQDDISGRVVTSISPTLTAGRAASAGPDDKNDYVDYLRARHLYLRGRDERNLEQVLEAKVLYEDLLLRNPGYARAHAGLADVWNLMAIRGEVAVAEGYPRARESAERALQLDDGVAEAWYALGDILVEYYWDQPAAKAAYDRAVELAPQDADGLRGYAYFLRQAGRPDEAVDIYRKTMELDPLSSRAFEGIYRSLLGAGRFDEVDAMIRNATAGMPESAARAAYAFIYEARREFDELGKLVDSLGQFWGPVFSAYFTALIERHRGDAEAGNEIIATIIGMDVGSGIPKRLIVARYYALFGDFDVALDYLDAAAGAHEIGLGEALSDYQLAELRKDPRFWDWVERMGIRPLE